MTVLDHARGWVEEPPRAPRRRENRADLERAAAAARARADELADEYFAQKDFATDRSVSLMNRMLGASANARSLEKRLEALG